MKTNFFAALLFATALGTSPGAQTVTYVNGDNNSTLFNLSTIPPDSTLILTITSGLATQSGVISGAGTLQKTGEGTVVLSAANTFSGTFLLSVGTIGIGNNSAFGTSTVVINGGEIRAVGGSRTVTNALTLNSSFVVGRSTTFTGNAALGASLTITANNADGPADADSTFSGIISGSQGLTIAEGVNGIGTGAIVLSGTNTYTGGTTISSGRLRINTNASLGNASSTLTINGGILNNSADLSTSRQVTIGANGATFEVGSNLLTLTTAITGTGALTKTAGNLLTLTGAQTYTGATTISAGALRLDTGSLASPAVNVASGASFNMSNAGSYAGNILGAGTFNRDGTGTTVFTGNATHTGGTNLIAGTLQIGSGGTAGSLSGDVAITSGATLAFNRSDDSTLSGIVSGSGGTLSKAGAGVLTLAANNTYTGATTITAGTLKLGGNSASSSFAISSGSALELNVAAGVTDYGTTTFSGTGTLRKTGAGISKWGLSIATFTLGSGSLIDVQGGIFSGGSDTNEVWTANLSDLNVAAGAEFGGVEANVRVDALSGAGLISSGYPGGGYVNFTFGVDNGSGTFTGTLSDSTFGGNTGNFVKTGTGRQIVSGTNTYTGTTTINGGILQFGKQASLYNATPGSWTDTNLTVASGATAAFNVGGANEFSPSDIAVISALGTATGGFTSGSSIGMDPSNAPGASFTYGNSLTNTNAGANALGLTKLGTGTLILSAANTYTGPTKVSTGPLQFAKEVSLYNNVPASWTATNLVVESGATAAFNVGGTGEFTTSDIASLAALGTGVGGFKTGSAIGFDTTNAAGGTFIYNTTIANTNAGTNVLGLVKLGAGTLQLGGTNTYTGGTTLSAGTLELGSASPIGTGPLTINGGAIRAFGIARTLSNTTQINGDFTLGRLTTLSGTTTLGANITITSANPDAAAASTSTLSGAIGGPFGLTFAEGANPIGTIFVSGTSSYTGPTIINAGIISISSIANGGSNSALGASTSAAANLVINGGNLTVTGFSTITNRLFTLGTAGGTLMLSNNSALAFSNTGAIALAGTNTPRTFTLNAASTLQNAFAPALGDNGTGVTSFSKTGTGFVNLTGANTYTGPTTVTGGGSIAFTGAAAGFANTNVVLNGGSLSASGNFSSFGTGAGQVQFGASGGGFSAFGAPLNVSFAGTPVWGTTSGFLPTGSQLFFHQGWSDNTVTWTSPFSLGTAARTISVGDNGSSTQDIAVISGVISSGVGGALSKAGTGTLILTGANTYTGATTITSGAIATFSSSALPTGNLALNGGVYATSGNFTRTLGTGSNQVQIVNNSGFAAYGGPLTITGVGDTNFGAASFVGVGGALVLSSSSADNVVTWPSNIALGSSSPTFTVNDNTLTTADFAVLSGVLSSTGSGFFKNGSGTLVLTGNNTYTGATTLTSGTLTISTIGNVGGGASSLGAPTTVTAGTINFISNGTLRYIGTGATTDRVISINSFSTNTIDASGTGALKFTSNLTNLTLNGNALLTLTGTSTAANEIQGAIPNGAGSNIFSLTKSGTGTWTLSGTNTYTGATNVGGGTLVLGSNTALTASSSLSVAPNTIGGNATVDFNGRTATIPTLAIGGGSGDTTSFSNIVGAGTINLGGALTFNNNGNPLGSVITPNINLGSGANRTISVNDSATAPVDLSLTGIISETGSPSGITKSGTGTLVLSGANTYTGVSTLSGGSVIIGSNSALGSGTVNVGTISLLGDGTARTIANPVNLIVANTLTVGGVSDFTFNGPVTSLVNSTGTGFVTISNTGTTVFNNVVLATSPATAAGLNFTTNGGLTRIDGVISNGSGTSFLIKAGIGTLELRGANTYTGGTTISQGTLRLGPGGTLSSNAVLNVLSSVTGGVATLDLNGQNATVASLNIGGAGSTSTTSVANITGAGTISLAGDVTFTAQGNPLGSTISPNLNFTTAATHIFNIADSTTAPIDLSVSGAISESVTSALTKTGTGTLSLTGASTYTGVTTILNGTLSVNSIGSVGGGASALGSPATVAAGTIAMGASGIRPTLQYTGPGETTNRVIDIVGIDPFGGAILDASGTGALIFTAAPISSAGVGTRSLILSGTSTFANEFQGAIPNGFGNTQMTLFKQGTGTWVVSGTTSTYTGTTNVLMGTLKLGANNAFPVGTTLNVTSNAANATATLDLNGFSQTVASINIGGGALLGAPTTTSYSTIVGAGTLSFGSLTYSTASNPPLGALISANLSLGNAARTFTINDSTTAAIDLEISGPITQTAISGLTKTGAGTLLLSGTNTYTGTTTVGQGALLLGSAGALPAAALLSVASTTGTAFLDLNGRSPTIPTVTLGGAFSTTSNIVDTAGTGILNLGSGGVVFNVATNPLASTISANVNLGGTSRTFNVGDSTGTTGADLMLSGILTGNAGIGLTKSGAGTLLLTGANTYTGLTTVSGGTLAVSGSGAISAANLVLNNGIYAGSGNFTRQIGTGPGQVQLINTAGFAAFGGPLSITGFTGDPTWNSTTGFLEGGGTLAFGSTSANDTVTWTNNFALGGASRTITVTDNTATAADLAVISAVISGDPTDGITKTGTGTLVLTGANTYTGVTTVSAGTLAVSGSGAISTGNLVLNGGVYAASGNFTRALGTSAGQMQFTGAGGFAAYGGPLSITGIGDRTWGDFLFLTSGTALVLGSVNADNVVTWPLNLALGAASQTITVNDNISTTADYAVVSGIISGTGVGLTKNGAGELRLTGANTYTGITTVSAGTLAIDSIGNVGIASSPLGAPATVANATIQLNGGTLKYIGSGATTDRALNFPTAGTGGALDASGSGALVFISAITATGTGGKTFTLTGTSTAANDFQGAIVNGSGTTTLTKAGTGTWTISGVNSYTGGTNVAQGTLILGSNTALPINTNPTVASNTPGGIATLDINSRNLTLSATPFSIGGATGGNFASASNIVGTSGTLTLNSDITSNISGNPLRSTIAANLNLGAVNRNFTVNDSTTDAIDLVVSGNISGTGSLTKGQAGTLLLSGTNTYTGATTLTNGIVIVGSNSAFGTGIVNLSTSGPTLQGDGTPRTISNALNFFNGSIIGGAGDLTFTGQFTNAAGTNSILTISNTGNTTLGNFAISNSGVGFAATLNATGGLVTVNGAVTNGGTAVTGSLNKTGTGIVELRGTNTYSTSTTVSDGTLRLGPGGSLGATQNLAVTSNVIGGTAIFDLNGQNATGNAVIIGGSPNSVSNIVATGGGTLNLTALTFNASNNLGSTISANINLGSAANRTFSINDSLVAATDLTISGNIGETTTSGFTKSSAGLLLLTGTNTYTGGTTISSGPIAAGSSAAFGTGPIILTGGTLQGDGTTRTLANAVNLQTNSTIAGASDLNLGALSNTSGSFSTFTFSNTGTTTFSSVLLATTVTTGITFTTNGGLVVINGAATNGNAASILGSLAKTGPGILELRGPNTYTGTTSVAQGTLRLFPGASLSSTTALSVLSNVAGGTATFDLNGADVALPGFTIGGTTGTDSTSVANIAATGGGTITLVGTGGVTYQATGNPLGSTIAANLNLGPAASRIFNVADSTTAAVDLTVSGVISESTLSPITKNGAGTLLLTAANTYTGPTNIVQGMLAVSGSGAISAGNLSLNGGVYGASGTFSRPLGTGAGQVALGVSGGGFAAYGGPLSITGFTGFPMWGTTPGFLPNNAPMLLGSTGANNVVTWTNDFDLGSVTRTVNVTDNPLTAADLAEISGYIYGSASEGLIKTGDGTLLLSSGNNYIGPTTISGGTLVPNAPGAIPWSIVLDGGVYATSGPLFATLGTGTGEFSFTANGGGFSAYTSPLNVSISGTPVWGSTANFLPNNAPLVLGSVNSTALLTWSSDFSLGAASRTITVNDNPFSTSDIAKISGVISGDANVGFTKNGAGSLSLVGAANTYTGPTSIAAGTLIVDALPNVGVSGTPLGSPATVANGTISIGSGTSTGTLMYAGSGDTTDRVINLAGTTGGAILDSSGAGPIIFTSALTATGAGVKTLTLSGFNTGANEFQGAIVNNVSGTTGLAKTGTGTWTISGANTYTGGTTVSAGTLKLGSNTALQNNGALTVAPTIAAGTATLDLNSRNATVTGITLGGVANSAATISATGGGTLTLGVGTGGITYTSTANPLGATISANLNLGTSAARTITVGDSTNAATDLTISGNIGETAASSLTKAGLGTLLLSGTNTYTGGTTLSAGTVIAGNNSAFGTGFVTLGLATTLQGDGTPRTLANTINFSSTSATIGGASNLTFNGLVNLPVQTLFTLNLTNSGTTTFNNLVLLSTVANYVFNTTGGLVTVSGMANFATFNKAGSGTMELAGTNASNAFLVVQDGTLRLASATALPSNNALSVTSNVPGGTAIFDLNGRNVTSNSLTMGGALGAGATSVSNIIGTGGGTLTLGGNVIYQNTGNPLGSTIAANINLGASATRSFTIADSINAASDLVIAGIIGETAPTTPSSIAKFGTGTLNLTATNTYTGATSIYAGTLQVSGSVATSSSVNVNSGGTLAGLGSTGPVVVLSGGTLSPGNPAGAGSVGTLSTTSETWLGGGALVWNINDATGTQGGANGWDFLSINGALALTATNTTTFTISLRSLTAGNVAGNAANFDPNADHTWIFATATGGATGFAANKFVLDTTGFTNPVGPFSSWTISQVGNNLQLNFVAIPEPGQWGAILGAALIGLAILRRRKIQGR